MVPRLSLVIVSVFFAFSTLLFHLYDLQLTRGEEFLARAESQYLGADFVAARRGVIYFTDREGNASQAVSNRDFPLVYAVPKVIEDASEAANHIGPLLQIPVSDLKKRFSNTSDTYELLAKKVPAAEAEQIRDLKLKGVYVVSASERFYPFGTLAANLLGYVGPNPKDSGESGHYGIEEYYDKKLRGTAGGREGNTIVFPEAGEDVTLTIDPSIQIEAERILKKIAEQYHAKGGSVIVLDPKRGSIIAMGSVPNFDPNEYQEAKIGNFMNPVTQQIYEPGSVFKVLTMAAGIDTGAITPETTFYDSGTLLVSGRKIENWDKKAHGTVSMTNIIEKSLNTGAAFAERQTGDEVFTSYLKKFGFGAPNGIDLPGELKGDLRRLTKGAPPVAFATASFGQGVAATPLQVISAFGAIANGGVRMRPHLNAAAEPAEVERVISAETARKVTDMMVSAVDKAEVAKIKGYSIAGKTGTAQVPDFVNGGYSKKVINTYVGFGPAKDPRFVILVKLDDPQGAPLAGTTVVPAFRDLAQFVITYYSIPPDRLGD